MNLKKYIVNKTSRFLEKKTNKTTITRIFMDKTKAYAYELKYGGNLIPLYHGEKTKTVKRINNDPFDYRLDNIYNELV